MSMFDSIVHWAEIASYDEESLNELTEITNDMMLPSIIAKPHTVVCIHYVIDNMFQATAISNNGTYTLTIDSLLYASLRAAYDQSYRSSSIVTSGLWMDNTKEFKGRTFIPSIYSTESGSGDKIHKIESVPVFVRIQPETKLYFIERR